MDPISLIVTALSSAAGAAAVQGAAHGISQGLTQGSAGEAYRHLKNLIKRKFENQQKPGAKYVLDKHEEKPEAWQKPLKEELVEAGADKDEEIIKAAQYLLDKIKEQPGGQQIINQTQTVKMKGVKVGRDFSIAPVQEGGKKT